MTIVMNHNGEHVDCPACYLVKLRSISFDRGRPKTHQRSGDPWDGNPVKERIEELAAEGRRNVAAYELSRNNHPYNQTPKESTE